MLKWRIMNMGELPPENKNGNYWKGDEKMEMLNALEFLPIGENEFITDRIIEGKIYFYKAFLAGNEFAICECDENGELIFGQEGNFTLNEFAIFIG